MSRGSRFLDSMGTVSEELLFTKLRPYASFVLCPHASAPWYHATALTMAYHISQHELCPLAAKGMVMRSSSPVMRLCNRGPNDDRASSRLRRSYPEYSLHFQHPQATHLHFMVVHGFAMHRPRVCSIFLICFYICHYE